MLLGKKKGIVGLDIGSSAVKLVELKGGKGGQFTLVNAGHAPLSQLMVQKTASGHLV